MYNKILLIGNVVKDVETKDVNKSKLSKFRIAVNDPLREKNTVFIDCEAWDDQAQFAEKWLKKGKGVIIDGKLCLDSWEKDGKKESKFFVRVHEIRFSNVGKKEDEDSGEKEEAPKKKQAQQKNQNDDEEFQDVPF
jgi:single-strand DNA-binding protein